jgi:hypothetical protein
MSKAPPAQDRALRRQPPPPGVHQRQPAVARLLLHHGAQRPAALQLHRDGAERVGGRGGPHLARRGQRDGRERAAAEALQEALRQSEETRHQAPGQRGVQTGGHQVPRQPPLPTHALEGQSGRGGLQRALPQEGKPTKRSRLQPLSFYAKIIHRGGRKSEAIFFNGGCTNSGPDKAGELIWVRSRSAFF